jgi:metal-responsive CopG/Arc/MetJ family transcriptional regulator
MRNALTISLPPSLATGLEKSAKRQGKTRSQVVQEALQRLLFLEKIDEARQTAVPLARKQGLYTDEDIFKKVS